jgi:hypothetical protein
MASQTPASGTETKPEIDKSKVREAARGMVNRLVSEATAQENLPAMRSEIAKHYPGADVDATLKDLKQFAWKLTKPT